MLVMGAGLLRSLCSAVGLAYCQDLPTPKDLSHAPRHRWRNWPNSEKY